MGANRTTSPPGFPGRIKGSQRFTSLERAGAAEIKPIDQVKPELLVARSWNILCSVESPAEHAIASARSLLKLQLQLATSDLRPPLERRHAGSTRSPAGSVCRTRTSERSFSRKKLRKTRMAATTASRTNSSLLGATEVAKYVRGELKGQAGDQPARVL